MFVKPALNVRKSIVQPENLRPERRRPARTRGRKEARWATPILAINQSIAVKSILPALESLLLAEQSAHGDQKSKQITITEIFFSLTRKFSLWYFSGWKFSGPQSSASYLELGPSLVSDLELGLGNDENPPRRMQ